ncbi:MAG: hypothetical protein JWP57_4596 [Spirosoma sp.]|nr:hypothetical protein [Spirosoma sp.]
MTSPGDATPTHAERVLGLELATDSQTATWRADAIARALAEQRVRYEAVAVEMPLGRSEHPDWVEETVGYGMSVADDLTEFLLARIAEDESAARALPSFIVDAAVAYERIHFARWAPARVLAECDAKRRAREMQIADELDRILALPYADHPDYRSEWRP